MMIEKKRILGFSFVEIIITISIIILLAVVGFTASNNYSDRANNTKITSDIETITNSLLLYTQEKGELPMPSGNISYFNDDASYAHSTDPEIFGMHGYITEDTLPKKYLDATPVDPKTNQYYAYGRTKDSGEYELAGVNWTNEEPESFVKGNFKAESGPYNLIREYNGPDFIYNGSKSNFPYNPDERIMTARVAEFDGTIAINGNNTLTDTEILAYTFREGDEITVTQGGFADIYFSDGTISTLADINQPSQLLFSKMVFKEETNLLTSIKLALGAGTIWSQAASLDDESEFEVYTTDATAAVRGTVFGLNKTGPDSNITVKSGKVKVAKVQGATDVNILNEFLSGSQSNESGAYLTEENIDETIQGIQFDSLTGETYIQVENGNDEEGVDITAAGVSAGTGAVENLPTEKEIEIIQGIGKLNNAIGPEVLNYEYDDSGLSLEIKLNKIFSTRADYLMINNYRVPKKIGDSMNWELSEDENSLFLNGETTVVYYLNDTGVLIRYTILGKYIQEKNISKLRLKFGKNRKRGEEAIFSKETVVPLSRVSYGENGEIQSTLPTISLLGLNPQEITVGNAYTEHGANAVDGVGIDISSDIVIDYTSVILSEIGDYEVTYNVTDSSNNRADEVVRIIKVVASPVAQTCLTNQHMGDDGNCEDNVLFGCSIGNLSGGSETWNGSVYDNCVVDLTPPTLGNTIGPIDIGNTNYDIYINGNKAILQNYSKEFNVKWKKYASGEKKYNIYHIDPPHSPAEVGILPIFNSLEIKEK